MARKIEPLKVESVAPQRIASAKTKAPSRLLPGARPGKLWGWPDREYAHANLEGVSPLELTGEDLAVLGREAGRAALDSSLAAGVAAPVLKNEKIQFVRSVTAKISKLD